jgi:hypothetical protein
MPDIERVRQAQTQRLRFLNALYDREDNGEHMPHVQDIVDDMGSLDREDWTRIQGITGPLGRDGLIEGVDTAEVGLIRVRLRPEGRKLVEERIADGGPTTGGPASIGDVWIEGSGNTINVAQQSPGAHQAGPVFGAYDLRKMGEWADDVQARVSAHGLDAEDQAEVQCRIAELKAELAEQQPDHSKLARIGRFVIRVLEGGSASLVSGGLVAAGKAIFG